MTASTGSPSANSTKTDGVYTPQSVTSAYIPRVSGEPGRIIAINLPPGAPLTTSIEQICEQEGIDTAVILSGIGTISEIYLRNPRDTTTLPIHQEHEFADEIDTVVLQRPMEIVSLQGNVTTWEGKLWAHCHITLSEAGGNVRGGHVFRATIWSQGELFIQEIKGIHIDRERDLEVTGLPQIRLHKLES